MGALKVSGVCRLGADPELKFTPSGVAVCSARAVFQDRYLDRQSGEWKDGDTTWVTLIAWRTLAENVAESFVKGDDVIVLDGTLTTREFELRDGGKGHATEITVREVGPSVRFHAAKSLRPERRYEGPAAGPVDDPWAEPRGSREQQPRDVNGTAQTPPAWPSPPGAAPVGTWQASGRPVDQRQARADQRAAQSGGMWPDQPPFFHRTPGLLP